jgi:hypothetical protein
MMQIDVSSWRYTVNTTIRKKWYDRRARLQGALDSSPCSFAHAASTSWCFSSAREAISVAGDFEISSIERKDTLDTVAPSHCSLKEMLRFMFAVVAVVAFTVQHSDKFPAVEHVECSYISVTRNLQMSQFQKTCISLVHAHNLHRSLPSSYHFAHTGADRASVQELGLWSCAGAIERAPLLTILHCDELENTIVLSTYIALIS